MFIRSEMGNDWWGQRKRYWRGRISAAAGQAVLNFSHALYVKKFFPFLPVMTITTQVHDFSAVCSFLISILSRLRLPFWFSLVFLVTLWPSSSIGFFIPVLPFCAYPPQPLSSALYRSAYFRRPFDPFHRAFPSVTPTAYQLSFSPANFPWRSFAP